MSGEFFERRSKIDAVAAVGRVELDEEGRLRAQNHLTEIPGLEDDNPDIFGSVEALPLADAEWRHGRNED